MVAEGPKRGELGLLNYIYAFTATKPHTLKWYDMSVGFPISQMRKLRLEGLG